MHRDRRPGSLVDIDDLRRRCSAHTQWMAKHPDNVTFAESWADQNLDRGDVWGTRKTGKMF
ncbi:uncharacterized protein RMCN_0738 [Mycolicibacterium novocastrense]|uniref:Uncharacterized protein n=1 Tax=Mycolicibacterium novocastrense TaxID=59813 RepID=A0ABQ0KDW2_MYCNV|nr:uncharacterized protein RMCN_0738 [Mycolicibacterium novocastrense]